ncbi:MAG: DUF1080 domain-containing protein [Chitinophagaceae bacterium]|nr:DUF1080 domain-containing protein [Chitinophagaceae bacterium]
MKKQILLATLFIASAAVAQDSLSKYTEIWSPVPRVVTPGKTSADAPSDAVILFRNKKDTANWMQDNGKSFAWKAEDSLMTVTSAGAIRTKQSFGDCQLHIEWRTPAEVKGSGQGRGNSGIFLMSRYELQVLDSYNNPTYSNGQAGSIYKQHIPLVNACRPPGEWQSYDILFTAPQFYADGSVKSPARITVFQNGILVQNNVELIGGTRYIGIARYEKHEEKAPILLQDHGNPVSFRNIWIREL